jgi:hypothetical protein
MGTARSGSEECWDAGSMTPGCVVKAVGDLGPLAMRAGDSRDSAGWRRAQSNACKCGGLLTRRQGEAAAVAGGVHV